MKSWVRQRVEKNLTEVKTDELLASTMLKKKSLKKILELDSNIYTIYHLLSLQFVWPGYHGECVKPVGFVLFFNFCLFFFFLPFLTNKQCQVVEASSFFLMARIIGLNL